MSPHPATAADPGTREQMAFEHDQRRPHGPRRYNFSQFVTMTILVVFAIYFLVPFFWLFVSATKNGQDLVTTYGLWIFTTIALWLMMPGVVTVMLFLFVAIWNNYLLPLIMLNDDQLFPITVGLTNARFLAIPGALISTIPLLIGCVFLGRYWRSGLGMGSIK
jgi:ABC-type glycerol-3-phosphate transport system permease component